IQPFGTWGDAAYEYRLGAIGLMTMLQRRPEPQKIIKGEALEFIFDKELKHESAIKAAWAASKSDLPPGELERYEMDPRFVADHKMLALQAADFWAWWSRKWYSDGVFDEKMRTLKTDAWES